MYAIGSLLVVVGLSLLITRVAVVVLVASGLSREQARFQARSAYTGAGFTTSESEKIVNNPLRRRVVMMLMLLGNAGVVASAGTLIIGFSSHGTGPALYKVGELALGLFALVHVSRSRWIDRRLTRFAARVLRRFTTIPARAHDELCALPDRYVVIERPVAEDAEPGRTIDEVCAAEHPQLVLGLVHADGQYESMPPGDTAVALGDTIYLYTNAEQRAAVPA